MYGIGVMELIILFVLFLPVWLIALVDVLRSEFTGSNKIVWLIVVILLPFVGPIAYFFIGRKQKVKEVKENLVNIMQNKRGIGHDQ